MLTKRELITTVIYILLTILLTSWLFSGIANAKTTRDLSYIGNDLWATQQYCDELVTECDELLTQQLLLYKGLKAHSDSLQVTLDERNQQLFEANNPPWHKDPLVMGGAGTLIGIFLTLSLQR